MLFCARRQASFDKRGIAQSLPAAPDERQLSVDQYVNDAVAWGDKLKADPRFGKVFLLGHSEGALIAVLAAPRGPQNPSSACCSTWPG